MQSKTTYLRLCVSAIFNRFALQSAQNASFLLSVNALQRPNNQFHIDA